MKFESLVLIVLLSIGVVRAQDKPNIVWLMAEDISLDLECYGMKGVKTPNLNKLAQDGVMFTNCFCTNSICSPNRSAMMTGCHQLQINAHNHRSNRDLPLPELYKPFTFWLREAGYTCIVGHHAVMDKGQKIDVNFKASSLGPWDGINNFGLFDKTNYFEAEDQPFFAHIQLKVTHRGDWWDSIRDQSLSPVNPDSIQLPPYLADHPIIRLDWAKYLDQIEFMDNEVDMILQELEEKGMMDNTVIIFIGDNGRSNIRGKGYLYDPGLHVPLIIYGKEKFKGGKIRTDIISTTDITATVLDLAGIKIPDYMTGMSFLQDDFNREEVYAARDLWDEVSEKSRAITTAEWKYIRNDMSWVPWDAWQAYLEFYRPALHIMRKLNKEGKLTDIQKLFFSPHKPFEELYNLKEDPFELKNLVGDARYFVQLEDMRKKTMKYDGAYDGISNKNYPVYPESVDLLEWIKSDRPELYQEMLDGVEIGFQRLVKEYNALQPTPSL